MDQQKEIVISGHSLYNSYVAGESHQTHGVISLKAHSFDEEARASRAPVDIIAVIDVSGSMAGEKMLLVQQTLRFLIDQLKSEDRLAIITFHSVVNVELSLTELAESGKTLAKKITSGLGPLGGTFLSGGLLSGLDLLLERSSSKRKNEVASMLFLTDGQATDGIKDRNELQKVLREYTSKIPDVISINTFGFGADHDATLLRSISDTANGMFYFINKSTDIALAFADCLGGLLSMVAQKIVVEVEATENATITALHSTYKTEEVEKGKKYKIILNDLFGEEERDAVCELHLPELPAPQDNVPLVNLKVTYNNLMSSQPGEATGVISTNRPSVVTGAREQHLKVMQQMHRLHVARALLQAEDAGNKNDLRTGQAVLQKAIDELSKDAQNDQFCQKLVGELQSAKSAMQNSYTYSSGGHAQLQSQAMAQRQQRSNVSSPMYQMTQQTAMRTASSAYTSSPAVVVHSAPNVAASPRRYQTYSAPPSTQVEAPSPAPQQNIIVPPSPASPNSPPTSPTP